MKKLLLLTAAPFIFLSALPAQITRAQADSIVTERMSSEMQVHTIFSKDGVQSGMTITTANDEILELDYNCFVYYVRYAERTNDKFLIVNANNGNLLEIRTQGNAEPEDWIEWRMVIPYKPCDDCPEEMVITEDLVENGILRSENVYLFRDSIPREIESYLYFTKHIEKGLQLILIVFYSESEHTVRILDHEWNNAPLWGRICNFPDFAKDWNVPTNGIKLEIEAVMYHSCNQIGPFPGMRFDFVLTNLKRR